MSSQNILDGSQPYVMYECKSAPVGLKQARWTVPRDPNALNKPQYSYTDAETRKQLRNAALAHLQPYNHVSGYETVLREIASPSTPKKYTVYLDKYLNAPLVVNPVVKESPRAIPRLPINQIITELKKFGETFAPYSSIRYVEYVEVLELSAAAINKPKVYGIPSTYLKSLAMNEWEDVSHLTFEQADYVYKLLLTQIPGNEMRPNDVESAITRLLQRVYGCSMPIMSSILICYLIDLSSRPPPAQVLAAAASDIDLN